MIAAAIYILVICAVAALLIWAVGELGTPDPLARILRVVIVVIAILIVIGVVAGIFGVHTGLPVPPL
jgi:hypothetical protein